MKKFITAVVAFALALTVVAPVVASAQTTASYSFNTNLTIGSRGADVVALQSFLEAKGVLVIPAGVSKGYFGSLTKNAVAAYQSMKGITPAAGYFGPITRAAVNAEGMSTTPTTPATPGCPAGAMYNYMTGQPCSVTTPTNPGLSNVEGTIELKASPTPANNANITSQNDVPVLGIEGRAKLAPVAIATIDLQVKSVIQSSPTSEENPGTFINTIKVWDGSTVLATVPVNQSTFSKDSSGLYYVRIPNLNFVVPQDTTKTLTVSFSVNSSIDTDRVVTVGIYGSQGIRTVTGNGVNIFYGSSQVSSTARAHTFKKPGASTLTISAPASPVKSTNTRVSSTNGATGVSVTDFSAKSETGDSVITTVYATTTYSGTAPTTVYLYDGSTIIGSASVTSNGGTLTFSDLRVVVPKDTTKTLSLKIDMPSNTTDGSYSSTSVSGVLYEKPNGTTATASGQVVGNNQLFYGSVAKFTLVGTPTLTKDSDSDGLTTAVTATFVLDVQAMGGTVTRPVASDFDILFASSTGSKAATSKSVTVDLPTGQNIADGQTARVTVTATLSGSTAAATGSSALYTANISSIDWVAGSTTVTNQTNGGVEDLKTGAAINVIR